MNWKKIGRALLFPHPLMTVLLSILAAALLIYGFVAFEETSLLSILSYVLSFYALILISVRFPALVRWIARFRKENTYYLRYAADVQLRINLSLQISFCFNIAYALLQLCLGVWHHSTWFYAMAGYYLLLAVMRLTLAMHTRKHIPGESRLQEWRKYRLCGICLLLLNLLLTIFILYFVFQIRIFRHHPIVMIAMAAYSFTSLALAIISVIRYRRYDSPAYSAAKDISLVCATVSILTLENAMLTTFGQEGEEMMHQVLLGISGAAVICIVQGIALMMIIRANRSLRAAAENNQALHSEQK